MTAFFPSGSAWPLGFEDFCELGGDLGSGGKLDTHNVDLFERSRLVNFGEDALESLEGATKVSHDNRVGGSKGMDLPAVALEDV